MQTLVETIHAAVRLFRGEPRSELGAIARGGLTGVSDVRHLGLLNLPPPILVAKTIAIIERHVLQGSAHSMFKSFTGNAQVAMNFAVHDSMQGVVLCADVDLVERFVWSTCAGVSQGFRDLFGRIWIPTASLRSPTTHEIARARQMRELRKLATMETEFLMLGHIPGDELGWFPVRRAS